jgi:hypothetical protein
MHAHHDGIAPEATYQSDHPGTGPVSLKNHQALFPIHHIKSFSEVRKDPIEGLQFQVGELLHQLGLDDCGPRPALVLAAVEAVV